MKKTQRLLATAMTPLLILHCLLTPLSVWADSLPVQPESTDYSNSAASSSEDESFVLNDEQQGVEVEQPTVSDNDSPSSVSSESASNATDSPKPENDVSAVFGSVSYQTAADDSTVQGSKADVEGGFAAAAGYTFDNVVFGPLSFKAGYSYVKGQDDNGDYLASAIKGEKNYKFDDFKVISASIAWGSTDNGLYIGALYNTQRAKKRLNWSVPSTNSSLADKVKGYEFVVGYTFDNGIGAFTGYNFVDQKSKVGSINQGTATIRRVPVYVNYAINGNFNIWGEAEFDANSSTTKDGQRQYPEFETGTMLSAGARYTF